MAKESFWTPENVAEAVECRKNGWRSSTIAKYLGTTPASVRSMFHRRKGAEEVVASEDGANALTGDAPPTDLTPPKPKPKPKPKESTDAIVDRGMKQGRRPGVIDAIVRLMAVEGGITEDDLVAKLMEKFPERGGAGMRTTVRIQSKRWPKKHGVTFNHSADKGGARRYSLPPECISHLS